MAWSTFRIADRRPRVWRKAAGFFLASCVMLPGTHAADLQNKTLHIPMKKLAETFDPQQMVSINAMVVNLQIHRGLMKFTPDLRVELDAASNFEIDKTGRIYTFTLADRSFSDGTKLTAKHVKLTFDRMLKKKIGLAGDLGYLEKVEVVDPQKIRFVLKHKSAMFNSHLASIECAILPLRSIDDVITQTTPGLGPFKVQERTASNVKLELHAHAMNASASVRQISFDLLSEAEAIEHAKKGKVDTLDGYSLDVSKMTEFEKLGMERTVTSVTRQLFLVLNPTNLSLEERQYIQSKLAASPFSSSLQAVRSLVKAHGLIPPGLNGSVAARIIPPSKPLAMNPKRTLRFPLVTSDFVSNEVGKWLRETLSEHFIVDIQEIDIETYMKQIESTQWDLFLRSKFLDYPDGLSVLSYFRSGTQSNTFFVKSSAIDKMIDDSTSEQDRGRRADMYVKIQQKILELATVAPILFGTDNQGLWSSRYVVPPHPLGLQGLPMETIRLR